MLRNVGSVETFNLGGACKCHNLDGLCKFPIKGQCHKYGDLCKHSK